MYINVFSFLWEGREKDIGRGRGRKSREYRVLLGIQENTKLKSCLGCYYAAGEEFLPYGFLADSVVVTCCDVIRMARVGSSDLLVCVFACSFLFVSDLLFWNGIHGKEAGFIRTAGESVLSITRLRESQGRRVKYSLRKVVCISGVERRALVNQIPISNRSTSSE